MDSSGIDPKRRRLEDNGGCPIPPVLGLPVQPPPSSIPSSLLAPPDPSPLPSHPADVDPVPHSNGSLPSIPPYLTFSDARFMVDLLSKDELAHIVAESCLHRSDVFDAVRRFADRDPSHRKIFVRGLGWDTNTVSLRNAFAEFGELEEAIAIIDKNTGKSRGYGFVTYKHVDGALHALKEPSKRIDGRITVCQLASQGSGPAQPPQDLATRKIYVGNVPLDWPADDLLTIFSQYGDIEEGPLGLDKQVGKVRGYALFIYKSADSAQRALEEPVKNIDGHQLFCKLAIDGSKQRSAMNGQPDTGELGGAMPSNMPYGATQYGSVPQGIMAQGIPYNRNPDPMHSGFHPAMNQGMNPNLHPNAVASMQTRPLGNNPSMPSNIGAQWQSVNPGSTQMGTPLTMSASGPRDPYGQQVVAHGGQGPYTSVGAPASSYSTAPASMAPHTPVVQGQYGVPAYQTQQSVPTPYPTQQPVALSSQSQQQAAPSSVPRVQQTSMPYYGV